MLRDGGVLAGKRDALALGELHLNLAKLGNNLFWGEPLLWHGCLLGSKSILSINLVQFHPLRSIGEGTVTGELRSGPTFPDRLISFGMFCNIFEFEGALIKRVNIDEDPDFGSGDADRMALANDLRKTA